MPLVESDVETNVMTIVGSDVEPTAELDVELGVVTTVESTVM